MLISSHRLYNALGHKLRFPQGKKAQFVTLKGIDFSNKLELYLIVAESAD